MELTLNESGLYIPSDYEFYQKPKEFLMSNRVEEEYKKWSEFIQWGRRNPVFFAERIFGVEFMDYQRYVFMMSWNTPYVVWCCSRNSGKSVLGSIFIMTKTLLIPDHISYILCGVGSQSIELFTKIEKFVYNQIPSFRTLTDVFQGELVKSQANSNGFVHNPSSFHFSVFNNSQVFTLNSNASNNRSKRSNLNFYDEAAFVGDEDLFTTSEPFTSQNSSFGLGVGMDDNELKSKPRPFHNQLIYASSAGRTDQYFFKKYREASIRMDAGDKRYFVADINSDMVIHATKHGRGLPEPLLTQETIDSRMREDKEAGLREYGNIFTSEGGDGQIIKRATIIRNSHAYAPVLNNTDGDRFIGLAYDPARLYDNSVIGVGEYYKDPKDGWKMRLINMISLIDIMKKRKTPLDTPNQIKILKQTIANYVPHEDSTYDCLISLLVDAGSGGAGVPITDFLCEEWIDQDGQGRRGLIDSDYNERDAKRFPDAIKNKLHLISPVKYKTDLFEALIKMLDSGLIEFPDEYLGKGYIDLIYEIHLDGKKVQRNNYPTEKEEDELRKKGIEISTEAYWLTQEEEVALKQIDAAKNELVNIYRFKQSSGKDRFDLAPEKANKIHDDRAYVCALLGYQLAQLRRSHIVGKKKETVDFSKYFSIRIPQKVTRY